MHYNSIGEPRKVGINVLSLLLYLLIFKWPHFSWKYRVDFNNLLFYRVHNMYIITTSDFMLSVIPITNKSVWMRVYVYELLDVVGMCELFILCNQTLTCMIMWANITSLFCVPHYDNHNITYIVYFFFCFLTQKPRYKLKQQ